MPPAASPATTNILVRGLPIDHHRALRSRAAAGGRTLNAVALAVLQASVTPAELKAVRKASPCP